MRWLSYKVYRSVERGRNLRASGFSNAMICFTDSITVAYRLKAERNLCEFFLYGMFFFAAETGFHSWLLGFA